MCFIEIGFDEFIYVCYGNLIVDMFEKCIVLFEGVEDVFVVVLGMVVVNGVLIFLV